MAIRGTGDFIRLTVSQEAKAALARKLLPLENVKDKYSASAQTQLGFPFGGNLGIPYTLETMKRRYLDFLGENEIKILRYMMRISLSSIKYGMYTKQDYAMVNFTSSIVSPYLWDVYKDWLLSCGFTLREDIRETVLIQDSYNQGSGRFKLMYGAKIFWSKKSEENVDLLAKIGVGLGIKNGYDLDEIL